MLSTWDTRDQSLVDVSGGLYKLTAAGLQNYWLVVDNAVQKWDRDQLNAIYKNKGKPQAPFNKRHGNDKYHWNNARRN